MAKNGFSMSKRVAVEKITADKTLTVDDCGKVFIVDTVTQGSAVDITMPNRADAQDGWNATFVMESGSGGGAAAQNVVWSGSAGDSTGEPFVVNCVGIIPAGASVINGLSTSKGTVTLAGTKARNGDTVKITMAGGNLLGDSWLVEAQTSGTLS